MIESIWHKGLRLFWEKGNPFKLPATHIIKLKLILTLRRKIMLKQGMAPAHPGEVLKGLYLDPLEVSITQAAVNLGVSRTTLSLIVNAKTSINAELALRLAEALNTTPELWLDMQQSYNLWYTKKNRAKVQVKLMRKKDLEINI